jgi:glycosyltransferase involved in cell wall biosynthesis
MTDLVFQNTSAPLVVLDADVLGRRRTGDETYVENLLRVLPAVAPELRFAAVTRRPDLVPEGVQPVELSTPVQELRMAWSLPRLLRRLRPAVAHFQHALPLACPCPAVVTIHDLSFEREPEHMGARDRFVFRRVVPRAARRAARVITVSERTKRDLVELYRVPAGRIAVTPNGVDPVFRPDGARRGEYVLFVGAIQPRKDPLVAVRAAEEAGLPLVVVGPAKDAELARELERRGADVRGYVTKDELAELYRGAACLVFPSRFEGFGLPVLEAMASGTPVVATPDPALREVAGDAALYAEAAALGDAVRRALADRDRLTAAGFERARLFSWEETARRTADVYRGLIAA